jgi:adenine/guanine phosphoribosyltransferase-like PRPP-binding protein
MHARLFTVNPTTEPLTGTLTLGNVSKKVMKSKMPTGSGYFLYFKLNDHADLVEEGARLIADRIKSMGLENPYFVTPEASTIALAHVLKTKYGIDGSVIYKNKQIDDVDPICVQYDTVTSTDKKQLFLGKNKAEKFIDKDIIILDSVCTTGGTIRGTYDLLIKAGVPANRIKEATMLFTEGAQRESLEVAPDVFLKIHAFNHLPILQSVDSMENTPNVTR